MADPDAYGGLFTRAAQDQDPAVAVAGAAAVARNVDFESGCRQLAESLKNDSSFIQYAAVLELDEFGPKAIRIARPEIEALGKNEYSGRLATHALSQISD